MTDSRKFWNRIASNYASQDNPGSDRDFMLTIEKTKKYLTPGKRVLDFACGPGSAAIEMADIADKVSAIDISDNMIKIAKDRAAEAGVSNIEFKVSDLFEFIEEDSSYDVVTGFNILHLVDDIDLTVNAIHSVLQKDGLFISLTDSPNKSSAISTFFFRFLSKIGLIPDFRQYSADELNKIIEKCGFTIIESTKLHDLSSNSFIAAKKEKNR